MNNKQQCPKCANNISKKEIAWLNYINLPDTDKHRQVVLNIENKKIRTDGFDPNTNTVYEFYGDYWHGNPNIFKSLDLNKTSKKTFGDLYKKTMKKEELIKTKYNLVVMWEKDWDLLDKSQSHS